MAAHLGDLALLQERFQKIFCGGMLFSDSKTVTFSVVVIDGDRTLAIPTVSEGIHAEILFIKKAKAIPRMRQILLQGVNIEITINLSKSPCFTCREDLEDFLESLTRRGATVTFILRIANLYFGDGGGEDENIEDLAFWLCHLNLRCFLQPILVVTEICNYMCNDVRRYDITEKRENKDIRIDYIVWKVKQTIAQGPVNSRWLFTTLMEVKTELQAREERAFYESSYESKAVYYVAVAQVQINAVNTVGRVKGKVLKPIEKHGEECCQTIPDIKHRIDLAR